MPEDLSTNSQSDKLSSEDYKKLLAKAAAVITAIAAVIAAVIFAATYEDSTSSVTLATLVSGLRF